MAIHVEENPGLLGTTPRPIFIIGSYRSGTSVLTWSIGQHPNILPLPETNWMARAVRDLEGWFKAGTANGQYTHFGWAGWDQEAFYAHMGRYLADLVRSSALQRVYKQSQGRYGRPVDPNAPASEREHADRFRHLRSPEDPVQRWVDGTPEYSYFAAGLARLFPEARFIHVYRSPLEVAMSLSQFSRTGAPQGDFDRQRAFETWLQLTQASWEAEQALGSSVVTRLSLAKLLANPEQELTRCLQHIGEDYSPYCPLPLEERINSSQVSDEDRTAFSRGQTPATSALEQQADALFELLDSAGPQQADASLVEAQLARLRPDE